MSCLMKQQLPSIPKNELRIAMWSGPRNISTAMLRSWGNRADTYPVDEPFYAFYLAKTGKSHPGSDEVLAHHESDLNKIFDQITGPIPDSLPISYQKHMAHHLLPEMGRDWFQFFRHVFLIRDPREMLLSLDQILDVITCEDTGLPQQLEIFDYVTKHQGQKPPVLDARDTLNHPREILGQVCAWLGLSFDEAMLSWPAGRRETDGAWAKYWYHSVEQSTEFQAYRPNLKELPARLNEIYEQCLPLYNKLYAQRIRVS